MPVLRADLEMQITICRFALRTDGAQLRSRGDSITKDKAALVPGPKYIDNVELAACDRQRHQAIDLVDRADGPGSDRVDGCSRIGGEVDTGMETTRVRTVPAADRARLPVDRQPPARLERIEVAADAPPVVGFEQVDLVECVAKQQRSVVGHPRS